VSGAPGDAGGDEGGGGDDGWLDVHDATSATRTTARTTPSRVTGTCTWRSSAPDAFPC